MPHENLAWVLTVLKDLQRQQFSGEIRLSLYQGQVMGSMKQVMVVKKS